MHTLCRRVVISPVDFEQAMDLLIKANAHLNAVNDEWETPLHLATKQRSLPLVECLVARGADVHATNSKGETPAFHVVKSYEFSENQKAILNALSKGGASLTKENNAGETLLHVAAERKNTDMVKFLTDKGLSLNQRDRSGRSPLDILKEKGLYEYR